MTGLSRRLTVLELLAEERRGQIRERVVRVMRRLEADLSPAEIEDIVSANVGTPDRIRQLRADGLFGDQIIERLCCEMGIETTL